MRRGLGEGTLGVWGTGIMRSGAVGKLVEGCVESGLRWPGERCALCWRHGEKERYGRHLINGMIIG